MIVTSTSGRIECDRISFYNGQATLWYEDEEQKGTFYSFKKLPIEQIAWILNYSQFKKED